MNTNITELKDVENLLESYSKTIKALEKISKVYDKQKQQVEVMYAFFHKLLEILSKADSKSNIEVQLLICSIRRALMTFMLKIKSIGENE